MTDGLAPLLDPSHALPQGGAPLSLGTTVLEGAIFKIQDGLQMVIVFI